MTLPLITRRGQGGLKRAKPQIPFTQWADTPAAAAGLGAAEHVHGGQAEPPSSSNPCTWCGSTQVTNACWVSSIPKSLHPLKKDVTVMLPIYGEGNEAHGQGGRAVTGPRPFW